MYARSIPIPSPPQCMQPLTDDGIPWQAFCATQKDEYRKPLPVSTYPCTFQGIREGLGKTGDLFVCVFNEFVYVQESQWFPVLMTPFQFVS